jgi:hypothetical protein
MLPQWKTLLQYARWSPSPHNVQSWKIKIRSAKKADVYIDKNRTFPILDVTGSFIVLGMGLFIEMLNITAQNYGAEIRVKYTSHNPNKGKEKLMHFAALTLVPSVKKPAYDKKLILQRRTSRLQYDNKNVPVAVLKKVASVMRRFDNDFSFTQDKEEIGWALALNANTVFYDYRLPEARRELGKWTRSSMTSAKKHRDGLAAYAMNVPSPVFWAFFHTNGILALPPFKQLLFSEYLKSMSGTKTIGWVQGDFTSFDGAVRCGRMLANVWLELTKHSTYLHPFGSMITNKQAKREFKEHFNIDEKDKELWLILRIGKSEKPPRSLRLDMEDILL